MRKILTDWTIIAIDKEVNQLVEGEENCKDYINFPRIGC